MQLQNAINYALCFLFETYKGFLVEEFILLLKYIIF